MKGTRAPFPVLGHLVPVAAEGFSCSSSGALFDGTLYIGVAFPWGNGSGVCTGGRRDENKKKDGG